MAWIFSGMSESEKQWRRRLGMPGGAGLVMDVLQLREGLTEVIMFEWRPNVVNPADRKPGVLSRGNSRSPRQEGAWPGPGTACRQYGLRRWGWSQGTEVCSEVPEAGRTWACIWVRGTLSMFMLVLNSVGWCVSAQPEKITGILHWGIWYKQEKNS